MEAVGAVGSLLAIVGFTLQSTKTIFETTRDFKDGPRHLQKLSDTAKELETVLGQIERLAEANTPSQHTFGHDVWIPLRTLVATCRDDVEQYEKDVASLAVTNAKHLEKVWKRIKTALKDKDFEKMWRTMHFHVAGLGLQLNLIESQYNTAREKNSTHRFDTLDRSFEIATREAKIQSDGIKAHISDRINSVQSVMKDLTVQSQNVGTSSTQVTEALGAATQCVAGQLDISTSKSLKAAYDLGQSLGSRLDGAKEVSMSQHSTMVELLTHIQKRLDDKTAKNMLGPDERRSSQAKSSMSVEQGCTALAAAIDRLSTLASEDNALHGPEAAEAVICDLELILNVLVERSEDREVSISDKKRKRAEDDDTALAVTTVDIKRMRGLLAASQMIDLACTGLGSKSGKRRRSGAGWQWSRTVWETSDFTAMLSCKSRPHQMPNRPHKRQNRISYGCPELFEGTVSLLPKKSASGKKLLVSFFQHYTDSGFTTLNPSLSLHAMISCDSPIHDAIDKGDLSTMLELFNQRKASVTDCDSQGRSLLNYAIYYGQPAICRFLIDHGADVNSVERRLGEFGSYSVYGPMFDQTSDWIGKLDDTFAIQRYLLEEGADPTVPSSFASPDGIACTVLWSILQYSSDKGLDNLLTHGAEYIDLMAENAKGINALTYLLRSSLKFVHGDNTWHWERDPNIDGVPAKIATLLRHGASPNLEKSSYFHWIIHRLPETICSSWAHERIVKCFIAFIKGGADIYAIENSWWSVTEILHYYRQGPTWEEALEACDFNVEEVYAKDHNRGALNSTDIYAPREGRPRRRGPMHTPAYLTREGKEIRDWRLQRYSRLACPILGRNVDMEELRNLVENDNLSERVIPTTGGWYSDEDEESGDAEESGGVSVNA